VTALVLSAFLVYELVRDDEATYSPEECNHIFVQVG